VTTNIIVSLHPAAASAVDPRGVVNQHQSHRRKLMDRWRRGHRADDSVELVSIFTRLFSGMSRISAWRVHACAGGVPLRAPARKRRRRRGRQLRNSVYGFHKGEVLAGPVSLLSPPATPTRPDKGVVRPGTPPGHCRSHRSRRLCFRLVTSCGTDSLSPHSALLPSSLPRFLAPSPPTLSHSLTVSTPHYFPCSGARRCCQTTF